MTSVFMFSMELHEKVQLLLKNQHRSQAEIAKAIGVYPSRFSEWMNEKGSPSLKQALRLAKALDVSLDYLADEDLGYPPPKQSTEDEKFILRIIQSLGLSTEEVARRLATDPSAKRHVEIKPQGKTAARLLAEQERLEEEARQSRKRSG